MLNNFRRNQQLDQPQDLRIVQVIPAAQYVEQNCEFDRAIGDLGQQVIPGQAGEFGKVMFFHGNILEYLFYKKNIEKVGIFTLGAG